LSARQHEADLCAGFDVLLTANVQLRSALCYRNKLAIKRKVDMMLPDSVCKVKSLYVFFMTAWRFSRIAPFVCSIHDRLWAY
jgi:hypothetical protein